MQEYARDANGRERGLSLLEVVVSVAILSVLFLVVLQSTQTVGDTSSMLGSQNTILIQTRLAVTRVHEDISTSRKVYEEDTLGRSYLDAMDFGSNPCISTGLLPNIAGLGDFDKDLVGVRRAGNILLLVGEMAPHEFVYSVTSVSYRVSVYRLIAYYVGDFTFPVSPGLSAFDLVRWESTAFADLTSLTTLTDPPDPALRSEAVASLVTEKNITYAWDPTAEADQAFYALTTDVSPTPDTSFVIPWCKVNDNTLTRKPVAYYRRRNGALAPNNTSSGEAAVPKFAQKVGGDPGFPHGFEVMIIGPSGARKILVRVVAEMSLRGRPVVGKSETIATMRDL